MQKKLNVEDSRNLVDVQNSDYVCGNINNNFLLS